MATGKTNNPPPRNPFRGMLIFVIILFIAAWLIYRSRTAVPAVQPANTDTAKSSLLSRESAHPE